MVIVRKRGSTGWPKRANVRASTLPSGAVNDSRPESTSCAMQTAVIAFDRLAIRRRRGGVHAADAERRHQVAVFHDGDAGGRNLMKRHPLPKRRDRRRLPMGCAATCASAGAPNSGTATGGDQEAGRAGGRAGSQKARMCNLSAPPGL